MVQVNEILQIKSVDDPNALPCHSRVEDIAKDQVIIAWPLEHGMQVPIRRGQRLSLSFVRQNSAYVFLGTVQEQAQKPLPHLKIRLLGPPQKMQRREYFRLRVAVDVEIAGVIRHPLEGEKVLYFDSHTYDLSGGGMAIRSDQSIPVGSMLEVKLGLIDGEPPLKVIARVVCSLPVQGVDGRYLSHIGISFPGIKDTERRRIVRYLNRLQRDQAGDSPGKAPGKSKR